GAPVMYQKSVLKNGVRVITEEIPMFNSGSIGVWVNVGSRHEEAPQNGITHFVEHMLFKGTKRYSAGDIAELVEGVGGYINGATDKEQTCFTARVMDQHVGMTVELICDMLLNSLFDAQELEREKGVIQDEIKTYDDSPSDTIQDMFMQTLWEGHPLGRPVIGTENIIQGMRRDALLTYMQQHYQPQNLIFTAAGRVKHDEIVRLVEPTLGSMTGQAQPLMSPPPQMTRRNVFKVKDVEQVYMCMGGNGVSMSDKGRYPLQVLDAVLGGGMSSRLFQEVREKRGLVYTVGSFILSYVDSGTFGAYVVTAPDHTVEVLRLMREITEDVQRNGITAKELQRAREYLKGSFSLSLESSSFRMNRLVRTETVEGRWVSPEEVMDRYGSVTLEEVNSMAQRLLKTEQFATVVLGPLTEEHENGIRRTVPGTWDTDSGLAVSGLTVA
ncbi:MAG TPA: pitrilysin family protein, partial [Candidatus Xenobia bacterium]